MQAQGMQAKDDHGVNGFSLPGRYSHRKSTSYPVNATETHMSLDSHSQESFENGSQEKTSSNFEYPQNEGGWVKSSNGSTDPIVRSRMSWRNEGSSNGVDAKEVANRQHGHSGNNANVDRKWNQRHQPPRLTGRARSQSGNTQLANLSPVPNNTIPSPLASPITATTNSLHALSISQTSTLSGRDLSKITIPRERKKSRPYSVSSAESLLVQEQRQRDQDDDFQDQSGRLSDPEASRRNGHGTAKSLTKSGKPAELRSPSLKPAAQLRVNLYNLVSTGYLPPDTLVIFREHSAIVTEKGTLIPQIKEPDAATLYPWLQSEYETPSAWATAMVKGGRTGKVAVNGWSAIKVPLQQLPEMNKMLEGQGLTEVSLDLLRKRYLADIAEDGSTQTENGAAQTSSLKDRKKRKRHVTASVDTIGLRITTEINTGEQKGRSAPTRPRKRTMSDLSGMVSSDLLRNRQLHLEAAGALFSMQDQSFSSTHDTQSRRGTRSQGARQKTQRHKHQILLESLARHRQEQELLWSQLSSRRKSSLLAVKAMSLVPVVIPLDASSNVLHTEFCVRCGASGQVAGSRRRSSTQSMTSHHWSSADSTEATLDNDSHGQDDMRRCFDCGECYHIDCIPSNTTNGQQSPSASDEPWLCPRCTICSCCQRSVHESPLSQPKSSIDSEEILVLCCYKCHLYTHLQCQIVQEPVLKSLNRVNDLHEAFQWTCFACRECVECGYRLQAEDRARPPEKRSTNSSRSKESKKAEGRWSNDSALCPSCTVLSEKGNICPLCCRIYQEDDYETPMIFCDGCSHWVHVACDKGLQDRDYEELGEDSRQYFCPSCIPTPIPSPAHSSSSSVTSASNSVEQTPWRSAHGHSRDSSSVTEEDWSYRGRKKKDDILDLIKAAKEISDSESQANSPYSTYSPMFPSTYSRTMSTSLESVAEVAAAEALLTILSGANTPVNSTPYTSYPPSPFEPSFNSMYEHRYSIINSPQDLPPLMRSMAFTPSGHELPFCSNYECQGDASCQCHYRSDDVLAEDYFSNRRYSHQTVPYHQIGQELNAPTSNPEPSEQLRVDTSVSDVYMEEASSGTESEQLKNGRGTTPSMQSLLPKSDSQSHLYQPFSPRYRPLQDSMLIEVIPIDESIQEPFDVRECILCRSRSDKNKDASSIVLQLGRLLPVTWNSDVEINNGSHKTENLIFGWIHSQCALWSSGVAFDSSTGGMTGVEKAIGQYLNTKCSACNRPGASIKCKAAASRVSESPYACTAIFHYPCLNHHLPSQATQLDQSHQLNSNANNAVVMDQVQRTILCSMHYREVSTLNDLRTAAFALQSSVMPANTIMETPGTKSRVSTLGLMKPWQGPIWIKQRSIENFASWTPCPGTEDIKVHIMGDFPVKRDQQKTESFRVGGLVIHNIGNFEPLKAVYHETGLANDIDLDEKYKLGHRKELQSHQQEVLALPFGFKCERHLLLEGTSKYSVVAEIVLHHNEDPQSDTEMILEPALISDQNLGSKDNADMDLVWKITVIALGSNLITPKHDRVFYSHSMRDAVETLFLSLDTELSEAKRELKQNKLYLQSPSTFFGLDHPTIRRRILSLKGEKEAASRMWLRYREDQRALERQCSKHGCFSHVSPNGASTKQEHSKEHIDSIGAARARSRPGSQLTRKRVVRVGIAFSHGKLRAKQGMDFGNLPIPDILQKLSAYTAISAPSSELQKESCRNSVVLESDISITIDHLQKLHSEQSNNVALYWNGRKVNTMTINSHGQLPSHRRSHHDTAVKSTPTNMDVDRIEEDISDESESSQPIHTDMRIYAKRAYQPNEMIMEYVGEVVSPAIAIRRQETYQKQGRGCYMMWCEFYEAVIDATIQGGIARHIRREDFSQVTVYAKAVVTSPLSPTQSPKVVICAAKSLEAGDELTM
ncbi:hypothetical protein BGZ49_007273, partial [Haplosporangium sp. Z 27]